MGSILGSTVGNPYPDRRYAAGVARSLEPHQ